MWNLEDYIGHDAYIVAASAVVYNAARQARGRPRHAATFKAYVERPQRCASRYCLRRSQWATAPESYKPDFFEVPTDFWLALYWTMLCGMLIYLLSYGARALLILRQDPRSRKIANIYLVASASASSPASCGSPPPGCHRCSRSRAARWCGSSPADVRRIRPYLGTVLAHQDQVVQHRNK